MKKILLVSLLILLAIPLFPSVSLARLGVGIGTGKIVVDEKLKSGIIYSLPPLTIVNTGDESAEYTVSVSYHTDQPEIKPEKTWFSFSPDSFDLKPGESRIVNVKLSLPLRTEPGTYFAYLEGSPIIQAEDGKSSVGIAAASKLYFEVEPSNIFEAIYFKIISFFKIYRPWPQRIIIIMAVVSMIFILKKFLNIEITFKKKDKKEKNE